jgi:hypothetical protein
VGAARRRREGLAPATATRGKAISALVATGDAAALPLRDADRRRVQTVGEDRVLIVKATPR